ncbi:hypothetical protein [Kribbella deserti]|uniref:Ig-like domain repeat protein n=1 Tax=Kribbella deserti TaxID=1926257 RepID=A0ABV6QDB3_9ACTN
MKTRTRLLATSAAAVLAATTLGTVAPAQASPHALQTPQALQASQAELPCMEGAMGKGYVINYAISNTQTSSKMYLTFWAQDGEAPSDPPSQRFVSRPDGSKKHTVTFNFGHASGGSPTIAYGNDTYSYGPDDAGTWILYDKAGKPWRRYAAVWATRFTAPPAPRVVTAGTRVTINHQLLASTATSAMVGVPGNRTVSLRTPANTFTNLSTVAGSTGKSSVTYTATSNRTIDAWYNGRVTCKSYNNASSAPQIVNVRRKITRTVSDSTPAVGQYVKVTGTVFPAANGQKVYLQRWNGSQFVNLVAVGTTSGKYTTYFKPATKGTHILRLFTAADSWNVASISPNVSVSAH